MTWKLAAVVFALVVFASAACAPTTPTAPSTAAPAAPAKAATAAPTAAPAATKPAAAAPTAAPKPAAKIKRGGTLNVMERGLPTLDPHISNATDASPIYEMMFNSLFRNVLVDPDACYADPKQCKFEIRGELVQSWDRPDPNTYVLKLRKGVKFHDGSDWNAQVAKWNLDRLATNPKSTGKDPLAQVKSTDVVDDYTLKLNLSQPIAIMPTLLSSAGSMGRNRMISKVAVEKLGDDEFGRKGIGSGPFKLKEWLPDQQATLEKFDGYWDMGEDGKPLPYLDGIVARYIPDTSVQALELRSGTLDLQWDYPLAPDIPAIKSNPDLVNWEWMFKTTLLNLIINAQNSKNPVLSQDLKLRQAIAYAVDRKGLVNSLGLGYYGYPRYQMWSPGMLGYDDTLPHYDYNVDKAKQLLKESGYAGQEFEYLSYQTEGRKFGELLKQMFGAIGIPLKLTHLERLAWVDTTRAHNFDMAELGQALAYEPSIQSRNLYTNGLGNYEGHQNKEMDKCMDDGAATDDPQKRSEAYRRCEQIIYEMAYRHPVYAKPSGVVFHKYVKGVTSNGLIWYPNTVWLNK
ncbi:MAG: ABC transporter substrate-binding protein [Bacteroidetes bacterium]|nr:ABC transporter substrate-binding protein [Bacteroidota bacterium]MCL5026363.1 ABC transporter substrate-binding protein [Chloroflexota bacterium]